MIPQIFDIIIVSWNNKDSLETTINSFIKNSTFKHNILVHLNEGIDGSKEMLESKNITYTISPTNVGLCIGANNIVKKGTNSFVCLSDDDMYALPNWDINLINFYTKYFIDEIVWLSSTMLERHNNTRTINYSWINIDTILNDYIELINTTHPYIMTQSTPAITQRSAWEKIGGYPEEFSPALGSDDGICKELWNIGCRNFVSVPDSLVYHFQGQSTSRVSSPNSDNRKKIFKNLYNIYPEEFFNEIKRGTIWTKK